ncbi:peroxiredoxin [Antricoccus suffuscus]|uniref:Peroxiredoxin n=1 Tax=Antricoccus suffuscus TaxID=1629062 RepID=A0A2T0ZRU5_9ACTN|nr:TlpA disulfide reductase family protein [Antricoccus suffuscus]PRZ39081.1 peroxiredoxin [Antricoccus suffuscus]
MTRLTANLLRAMLVLMSMVLLAGCTSGNGDSAKNGGSEYRFVEAQPKGEVIPQADRKPAPDLKGELLNGDAFALSSLKGKVVVLNFWATWCAPCRVEAPELQKIYAKYKPDGVALVGVLVRDSKDQGEIYAKQEGLTYPSLYDPKTQVALQFRNYPIVAIPSTIVFDKKGEVAAAYVSTVDAKSLTKTLDQLLAEK